MSSTLLSPPQKLFSIILILQRSYSDNKQKLPNSLKHGTKSGKLKKVIQGSRFDACISVRFIKRMKTVETNFNYRYPYDRSGYQGLSFIVFITEAVSRTSYVKKVLLKISQHLQENTCVGVSFLIKRLQYRCFPLNFANF